MKRTSKTFRVLTEDEQKERSAIIRAGCAKYTDYDCLDYASFTDMDAETGRKLIETGYADPSETQNDSPEFETMVSFCENHPGFVLHGYTIGGDRSDARVSAEGVRGRAENLEAMLDFIDVFRHADDLDFNRDTLDCYCWYD